MRNTTIPDIDLRSKYREQSYCSLNNQTNYHKSLFPERQRKKCVAKMVYSVD